MPPNFGKRTYSLSFSEYLLCILGFPVSSVGKESACNTGDPGSIPGLGRFFGEGIGYPLQCSWACFVTQLVKNLPAMWETWVRSLGWWSSLGEGKRYPLQYSGEFHGWGCKELDMTEQLSFSLFIHQLEPMTWEHCSQQPVNIHPELIL